MTLMLLQAVSHTMLGQAAPALCRLFATCRFRLHSCLSLMHAAVWHQQGRWYTMMHHGWIMARNTDLCTPSFHMR